DAETVRTIYFSGLLHDIGKIGINDEVLRKPGKLSEAEFEHIKTHVEIGYRILVDLRKMAHMLPVVLHHHENWDGRGYPHGLAGEEIPYLARIVAVADAYDAMASDRPYRAGMDDDKLDSIIRSGAGQQWDPRVVEAFFSARDDIRAISGRGPREHGLHDVHWS
ncbi:MAG TPA: HD domain-containing phosphohydrolase, partial [Pirellulales bacterium]|nr:HD domain-containing phosphohydrolase [Pirellulales bacterium]